MLERALLQPLRNRQNVGLLDGAVVLVAQQVFQQHLHGIGELGNSLQTILLGGGQAVIDVGLAADLEGLLAFEAVERGHVEESQFIVIPVKGIKTPSERFGVMACSGGWIGREGREAEPTLPEQAHYLGHRDALKPALSVMENLAFWRDYLGAGADASDGLAAVGLDHAGHLPAAFLSAGQRRRLSIA